MDEALLLAINQGWAHPWLDVFFAWLSRRDLFAFPMLLAMLWWCRRRFGADGVRFWALLIVVVLTSDALGGILKVWFALPRPCAAIPDLIRGDTCPGNLNGMPSNHALNFFSAATFLALVLRGRMGSLWLYAVATLVGVSRIYLGKHYPSQVLTGAALGSIWGALWAWAGINYGSFVQRIRPNKGTP